jgi:hypothetical protein
MRVINPEGRVVSVSDKTWEFIRKRKDFRVYQERSSDFTVIEAREKMKGMNQSELEQFLEGETRKTLCINS